MRKNVLVIVDMQDYFCATKNVIQENIEAIQTAIKNKFFILVLEFAPKIYGKTNKKIRDAIGQYEWHDYVSKWGNNGSDEVKDVLDEFDINPKRIFVTGVNRSACVRETVIGLTKFYESTPITILHVATSDTWSSGRRVPNRVYDLSKDVKKIVKIDRVNVPSLALVAT